MSQNFRTNKDIFSYLGRCPITIWMSCRIPVSGKIVENIYKYGGALSVGVYACKQYYLGGLLLFEEFLSEFSDFG